MSLKNKYMNDLTFYLEHAAPQDKGTSRNTGNVIAAQKGRFYDAALGAYMFGCYLSYQSIPNSAKIELDTIRETVLMDKCTEITEEEARIHHPNLFIQLDNQ